MTAAEEVPEVYCPFADMGPCILAPNADGSPACPTLRERACLGDDDE